MVFDSETFYSEISVVLTFNRCHFLEHQFEVRSATLISNSDCLPFNSKVSTISVLINESVNIKMNAKGTEFSIFQGAPSIHVDNNQQRIEEEEALQDQIRRTAEVKIYLGATSVAKYSQSIYLSIPGIHYISISLATQWATKCIWRLGGRGWSGWDDEFYQTF